MLSPVSIFPLCVCVYTVDKDYAQALIRHEMHVDLIAEVKLWHNFTIPYASH